MPTPLLCNAQNFVKLPKFIYIQTVIEAPPEAVKPLEKTTIMTLDELETTEPTSLEGFQDMNEKTCTLIQDYMNDQLNNLHRNGSLFMNGDLAGLWHHWLTNPVPLMTAAQHFWTDYFSLAHSMLQKMYGMQTNAVISPEQGDRRFTHEGWDDHIAFDYIKQFYLLASRFIYSSVTANSSIDETAARKIEFYTKQWLDAMAPTNFVATNPAVLEETVRTSGANLYRGLMNLIEDARRGGGKTLLTRMTDNASFEVGRNIATTEGKVVYQTEMFQLIQYAPSTGKVFEKPLLIIPPWINKYYILDLRAENSFIKWAVDQGHTVFLISWINPDSSFANKSFADYMTEGVIEAVDAVKEETGCDQVNAIGYCIGGTMLAATAAWYAKKRETPFASLTFFTTMIDFSEPGDLGVFVDEEQLRALEIRMKQDGYLEGTTMATVFNLLRANDLIWPFVINNYLMGQDPAAFDLLYWNSDSTRLPAANHIFYLRNCYIKNLLCQPDQMELAGEKLDMTRVKTPAYFISTRDDHITPWKSTYAGAKLLSGPVRFVLGGSGHIAGVINPPSRNKYSYATGGKLDTDPDAWLQAATEHAGSWWPDWQGWIGKHGGRKVTARTPGAVLGVIEDAPGSYVKHRIVPD